MTITKRGIRYHVIEGDCVDAKQLDPQKSYYAAGDLAVTGHVKCARLWVDKTLTVSRSMVIYHSLRVGEWGYVNASLTVGGSVVIGEKLDVDGFLTTGRSMDVGGPVRVGKWLTVVKNLTVGGDCTVAETLVVGRRLRVKHKLSVGQMFKFGKKLTINGPFEVGS